MGRFIDLTGQQFGRLTVIKVQGKRNRDIMWECKCNCGNTHIVSRGDLRSGMVKSCGCLRKENSVKMLISHGQADTRLYKIWLNMKRRCSSPKCQRYERYGARGILVCEEWEAFENFYKWAMESGYSDELTIDRINIDKNYSPENCRWATRKEQQQNTSRTHWLEYKGEKHCLSEWAEIIGINYKALFQRLNRGWSVEKAFNTPLKK